MLAYQVDHIHDSGRSLMFAPDSRNLCMDFGHADIMIGHVIGLNTGE